MSRVEYPKEPKVIYLPNTFGETFDCDDFFNYLLENKIVPNPRRKYLSYQSVTELKKVHIPKSSLLKLKAMGLLTFVKRGDKTYILKDNLFNALKDYFSLMSGRKFLKHCKIA